MPFDRSSSSLQAHALSVARSEGGPPEVILRDVLDAARIIQLPKHEGRPAVHDGPVEAFLRELFGAHLDALLPETS